MFLVKIFTDIVTILCLLTIVLAPSILTIPLYPISKKACRKVTHWARSHCPMLLFAVLKKYKNFDFIGEVKEGVQVPNQFLILSNHQSLFDIPVYMNFFRDKELRYVAKAELGRHIPLISEMLRVEEHCLVPRTGGASVSMRVLDSFGKRVVERNQNPVLFPEGTRSRDGNLGKFYSAGFRRLNEAAKLPVAVCALDGGYKIGNLTRIMANLNHGSYRVKLLGVFPAPNGKEEEQALLDKAHSMIQEQLDEWRSEEK